MNNCRLFFLTFFCSFFWFCEHSAPSKTINNSIAVDSHATIYDIIDTINTLGYGIKAELVLSSENMDNKIIKIEVTKDKIHIVKEVSVFRSIDTSFQFINFHIDGNCSKSKILLHDDVFAFSAHQFNGLDNVVHFLFKIEYDKIIEINDPEKDLFISEAGGLSYDFNTRCFFTLYTNREFRDYNMVKWGIHKNKLTIKAKSNITSQDFDLKEIDYCNLMVSNR
jgi:hypothetical protein